MSAALSLAATNGCDRFGNPVDPAVGYARGEALSGEVAESLRQKRAHGILRERYRRLGEAGIFNLTGLIRGYPLAPEDEEPLRSYVHFNAMSDGELEPLAIERMGGTTGRHDGFLATRVTAGMLAVMMTLLKPGDRVLSLVAGDRSHPSVRQAVTIPGGTMTEFTDPDAFAAALRADPAPRAIVVTAISPSKNHLPAADIRAAVELAHARGALVVIDDAHMAARVSLYGEPGGLALGADIAIWSLDKHVTGPRSGFVAGDPELIRIIRARALSLGVEAQIAQYMAGLRAVQAFDPRPIQEAARMSQRILAQLNPEMDGKGYLAGAGLAVSGEDFLEIAMRRARKNRVALVPIEAVSFAAMRILEAHGAVLIPAVGMPGSACTFRLMLYPDGARFGEDNIIAAWRTGIADLIASLEEPDEVRRTLTGS